jgi:hypothetical protein
MTLQRDRTLSPPVVVKPLLAVRGRANERLKGFTVSWCTAPYVDADIRAPSPSASELRIIIYDL